MRSKPDAGACLVDGFAAHACAGFWAHSTVLGDYVASFDAFLTSMQVGPSLGVGDLLLYACSALHLGTPSGRDMFCLTLEYT